MSLQWITCRSLIGLSCRLIQTLSCHVCSCSSHECSLALRYGTFLYDRSIPPHTTPHTLSCWSTTTYKLVATLGQGCSPGYECARNSFVVVRLSSCRLFSVCVALHIVSEEQSPPRRRLACLRHPPRLSTMINVATIPRDPCILLPMWNPSPSHGGSCSACHPMARRLECIGRHIAACVFVDVVLYAPRTPSPPSEKSPAPREISGYL